MTNEDRIVDMMVKKGIAKTPRLARIKLYTELNNSEQHELLEEWWENEKESK